MALARLRERGLERHAELRSGGGGGAAAERAERGDVAAELLAWGCDPNLTNSDLQVS